MQSQGDLLNWPTISQLDWWLFGLFVLLVIGIALILYFIRKRSSHRQRLWLLFHKHARRRGLNSAEIEIMRGFFDSLKEHEIEDIFLNHLKFYRQLYNHFARHPAADSNVEVRIIDKLFATMMNTGEVTGLQSLRAGEACSLEFPNGEHHLGRIISGRRGILTLGVPDLTLEQSTQIQQGLEVRLYVYRPGRGAYRLFGELVQAWQGGVRFLFKKHISFQGEIHYMCRMELQLELSPWPPLEIDVPNETVSNGEGDNLDAARIDAAGKIPATTATDNTVQHGETIDAEVQEQPTTHKEAVRVTGQSVHISDRALTLESTDLILRRVLRQRQTWELRMHMPDGFVLTCRGRLIAMRASRDRYLFKYMDISDNSRKILFALIKENNPVRERLV